MRSLTCASKEILQQTLFDAIVSKQKLDTEENDNARTPQAKSTGENDDARASQAKSKEQEDEYFWAKGKWLSEVTNVKAMVEVYDSIRDLW